MKRPARASALIAVLMTVLVMFILGMALLTRQTLAYREATAGRDGMAAQLLAEAGLEDARVKLNKDQYFPPQGDPTQQLVFTYSEDVVSSAGQYYGSYTVSLDSSNAAAVMITSVGRYGPRDKPGTLRTLVAELSVAPAPNPNLFKILRLEWR